MKCHSLFLAITFLFVHALTTSVHARTLPAKAVCAVPMANAFSTYVGIRTKIDDIAIIRNLYHTIHATNVNDSEFIRVHMIVLHEIVTVLEERNGEWLVQCSDHFHQDSPSSKPQNTYAVLAEEFVFLDELEKEVQEKLPTPLEYYNERSFDETGTIFTLGTPPDEATVENPEYFFSETRFLIKEINGDYVTVFVLQDKKITTTTFALSRGRINTPRTEEEKRTCIVEEMLKECAGPHVITTNWGGRAANFKTEYAKRKEKGNYRLEPLTVPNNGEVMGYNRAQTGHREGGKEMGGFARSNFTRCNAPAGTIYKTTQDWWYHLPALSEEEEIKAGYAVCGFTGYLGWVSSVEKNEIMDVRSYSKHHGVARNVKLSENFKGIETYEDLLIAYRTGQPLILLGDNQEKEDDPRKEIGTYPKGKWKIAIPPVNHTKAQWEELARLHS
jgi:hypothetical protein